MLFAYDFKRQSWMICFLAFLAFAERPFIASYILGVQTKRCLVHKVVYSAAVTVK